jgi:hypothetical protein
MSFGHWPASSCIHICDLELPRSINVKYGVVCIPQYMPRIFTSNLSVFELFAKEATEEERAAIDRRIYCLTLEHQLFL